MKMLLALALVLSACDVSHVDPLWAEPEAEESIEAETYCATDLAAGCEIARAECAQRAASIWEYVECPRAAANCFARAGRPDLEAAYRCETDHATQLARAAIVPQEISVWCGYRP